MRPFPLLLLIAIFFANSTSLRAQSPVDQVTAIGSNLLRVGSGRTASSSGLEERKNYLEEIANARIFFKNISLGLRYEMDDPSEVGPSYQGLRRRWIQYQKDRLNLQAGNVSALFGRGLTVNLFESRPVNYDSWLDGIYGEYGYQWTKDETEFRPNISLRGVAGKLAFIDVAANPTFVPPPLNISARAVNGEVGIWGKKVLLGGAFLQAFTDETVFGAPLKREVNQPGGYLKLFSGEFDAFVEWTVMRTNILEYNNDVANSFQRGSALYGAASYANEDFGVTFEYKDYRYNLAPPLYGSIDKETNRVFEALANKLPVTSPPEVYKEFTYTSITRGTHAVNFNDELGAQAEISTTMIPGLSLSIYGAASSRHHAYERLADSNGISVVRDEVGFFPNFKDIGFRPFWEASLEGEYEIAENSYVKFIAHRRSDVVAYNESVDRADLRATTTVASKFQYSLTENQSLLAIFEHQWINDYQPAAIYTNDLLSVQYSPYPYLSFGGMFDYSTFYGDEGGSVRHIWPQAFASVRIGQSHTLLTSYGAERGGINCSGGICRSVPAFNGFRLTITSQL